MTVGDRDLLAQLRVIMGPLSRKPPIMSNARRLGAALKFQVRSLRTNGSLEEGKQTVRELVTQLLPDVARLELHSLRQGFSGASVFRVALPDRNVGHGRQEPVLKLTRRRHCIAKRRVRPDGAYRVDLPERMVRLLLCQHVASHPTVIGLDGPKEHRGAGGHLSELFVCRSQ